jgi:hypothetical protein
VEYLLLNDHCVVVFDGLDELTDVSLRGRVANLIRGFVLLYPLVPVIVTSRRVGYEQAPLDPALLATSRLTSFDNGQVAAYVRHWFALDDGSSPAERTRLGTAFLAESRSIDDLRRSPLLLGVLCAMYAADHYIPGNRSEIYERCALMVYERWDRMRGIPHTLGFEGRVRGAVQNLAWTLFTGGVTELPRRAILRVLRDHLIGKGFDEDQADEVAADFLDYCRTCLGAGRGRLHKRRADLRVRPPDVPGIFRRGVPGAPARITSRALGGPGTPGRQGRLGDGRPSGSATGRPHVEDGADEVLRLAVDVCAASDPEKRKALAGFCIRSLADVCITPRRIEQVITLAVDESCRSGMASRIVVTWPSQDPRRPGADDLLHAAMSRCLPGNLPFVCTSLAHRLSELMAAGVDVAFLLALGLDRHTRLDDSGRVTRSSTAR